MKIGVLQAGLVPDELAPEHGEYDRVFAELVRRADPSVEIEGWRVVEGEFPPRQTLLTAGLCPVQSMVSMRITNGSPR